MKKSLRHSCYVCGARKLRQYLHITPLASAVQDGLFVLLCARCWLKVDRGERITHGFEGKTLEESEK